MRVLATLTACALVIAVVVHAYRIINPPHRPTPPSAGSLDRKHAVRFEASWYPWFDRIVIIDWKVGGHGDREARGPADEGFFALSTGASPGSTLSIVVTTSTRVDVIRCKIFVDGEEVVRSERDDVARCETHFVIGYPR